MRYITVLLCVTSKLSSNSLFNHWTLHWDIFYTTTRTGSRREKNLIKEFSHRSNQIQAVGGTVRAFNRGTPVRHPDATTVFRSDSRLLF